MTTPAGWYPEPDGRQQRYWDGERWTEHVAPLAGAATDAAATSAAGATAAPTAATEHVAPLIADPAGGSGGNGGDTSTGKVIGGIAAAVVVAIAGFFAYTQFASADGGADSPEAAVESLMVAVSNEDLVGVAEAVLPGERRTYIDPTLEALSHLQRWNVLADDLDITDVAGFDVEVSDLQLRTEPVADDVVNVYASGSITAALHGEDLPIGDVIGARIDEDPAEWGEPAETLEFDDVMITAVEEDGRWYVSAMYTLGETVRAESGAPMPDGITPIGANSPEAAVDGMLDAVARFDLEGVIARLNPDEAQALQRYAPLFLDEAQADLDQAVAESGIALDIEVEQQVVRRDDIAIVSFPSFSITAAADGELVELSFDGECTTIAIEGETEEICTDEGAGAGIDFTDTPAGDLAAIFDDLEPAGLVVAQRDGQWYVSPVRSVSESMLSVMRAIDSNEFDRIVSALEDGSLIAWFEDQLSSQFEAELEDMFDGFQSEVCDVDGGVGCLNEDFVDDLSSDLDDLVVACQAGDMEACDDLYWTSPVGSSEELVALTCGGTAAEGTHAGGDCAGGSFNGRADTYGDDPTLDALWDSCEAGDMTACDDLFWSTGIGTGYETFAQTCGGRLDDETFGDCVGELGPQAQ